MSVHNGSAYLHDAIESILDQTFDDFEFLIIDDASTDNSIEVIKSFRDQRIKIITNENNIGLTRSLNKGLGSARGKYIARMDADDISLPQRFEKQVQFLDSHPETGICGTWVQTTERSSELIWKYPIDNDNIKCSLIFESAFAHPSVMMRRQVLADYNLTYSENFYYAQDYDLWVRCACHTGLANLSEVLLLLRQHPAKIGSISADGQHEAARRIRCRQIQRFGMLVSEEEYKIHNILSENSAICSRPFLEASGEWLTRLWQSNHTRALYPETAFSQTLAQRWYKLCRSFSELGIWTFRTYRRSPLSNFHPYKRNNEIRLFSRCLVRKGYWLRRSHSPPSA